jgi:hypothetical protein
MTGPTASDAVMAASLPSTNALVTLVCAVFVAVYAVRRYNTPETNRLSTTQSLFYLTGAGYLTASVALFIVLYLALKPGMLPPGMLSFFGIDNYQELIAKYSAPQILAAAILTALLPNVPLIDAWDKWVLQRFQAWGSIPQGVRNLADMVERSPLAMDAEALAKLRAWISDAAEIPSELANSLSADPITTSQGNFTRTLRFYREVRDLEDLPAYANAFRVRHDAWQTLSADFQVFTAQSFAFFALFDQLTRIGEPAAETLRHARERYHYICRNLRGHLAELVAGLLLMVEGSEPRINSRLQGMGFSVREQPCAPLPIGPFVFMGTMLVLAILALAAVVRPPNQGPLPIWLMALLIGLTKTIGVLAAVLPKLRWSAFRRDANGELPYLGWLISAGGATAITFLIERAALVLAQHDLSAAYGPITPLAPTTFTISLAVSILCDVDLPLGRGWARRISEGALCGAAMTITLFVCVPLAGLSSPVEQQTSPWFVWLFSFALGFMFGFIAPHLYRWHRDVESQPRMAAVAYA